MPTKINIHRSKAFPLMKFVRYLSLILGICWAVQVQAATTLLPNGKQCFEGVNGAYSSGSMNLFIPGTTTPKQTWQDSAQVTQNTQPIQLDANGCAILYGVGSYRQQLFDGPVVGGVTTGNLIWDQITTDTSAYNSVFWAGISAGTPNVILITDTGFNGTDGSVVQFVALATNTASTTINPSGFGNILVQKSTTAGPVSLSGGEIVQGNVISAVYSSSSNTFQLLNAVIQSASGSSAPLCGATGLRITNNPGTPNTIINLTADQLVMQTNAGIVQSRNNVSLTSINISTGTTTSTANGMDGEAPGVSAWLYIYAIDNGAAPAGLVSLSATAPTLPSGYTYKCRLGSMRVDGSGNLLRTLQAGNQAQYTVATASNTTSLPVITSSFGTFWTAQSVVNFVPTTATRIKMSTVFQPTVNNTTNNTVGVAPNGNYTTALGATGTACSFTSASNIIGNLVFGGNLYCELMLESSNVYTGFVNTNGTLLALGWTDKVNAN